MCGGRAPARRLLHPEQLDSLYALADCLVLPTLHEGFGLPVLEAMGAIVPVACSDIPALREVAGSAALYFDPRAPAEIAAKIDEVLADAGLAERLRELWPRPGGRLQLVGRGAGDAGELSPGARGCNQSTRR